MRGKYFLVALMVAYTQHIGSSHILTPTYMETNMPSCMKWLEYSVVNVICPSYYGEFSDEVLSKTPMDARIKKWEYKERLIKNCCMKPCAMPVLLSMC